MECQGEMIFEDGEILSEILSLATLGETLNHWFMLCILDRKYLQQNKESFLKVHQMILSF